MARSILEIATEVCDRETIACPSTLFGTNDKIARILRTAAKDTLRDLMRSAMKNGVSGFVSQWVFATKPNIYAYRLPPDFYKMVPGTEQRDRWPLGILGPVSPQTWSNWIAGTATTAVPMGWRIKNNLIHIEPPPSANEIVVIEYLSRYLVARDATDEDLEPVNGILQPISPLVPREGYIAPGSLEYVETTNPTVWGSGIWGVSIWGTTPTYELRRIPGSSNNTSFPQYQVRAEEFASDSDTSALDDDHVLSLGMSWRLLKAMRRPYAEARDEFEREKEVFLANDASAGRDFIFGDDCPHEEVMPLGGDNWLVT